MNFSFISRTGFPVNISIFIVLFILCSCVTDKVLEVPKSPDRLIRALFSPNGLGDFSYNDDILRGILQEKEQSNFRLHYLSPADMDEAETILSKWQEEDTDLRRYFTILAGSEFEDVTRRTLPAVERTNYVMFDSSGQDITIPTFRFCGYGVSFLAGVAAYSFTQADTAAYLGGQRGECFIEECYEGFRAGYLHAGGKEVVANYISEESYGFAMPGRAYLMADSLFRLYPFIYVMAGGSNNGVYEFLREHREVKGYTNGVDVDQSAFSDRIIGSMIKDVGSCVRHYIRTWVEGGMIPRHREYDLRSGYMSFQVSRLYRDTLEQTVENSIELAIAKEIEYKNEIENQRAIEYKSIIEYEDEEE